MNDPIFGTDLSIISGRPAQHQKRFTVLLGCYGDFPQYSVRAMDSIASGIDVHQYCEVLIGLNECGPQTKARARALADAGLVDAVVESRRNLNKDPMMRLLREITSTPYMVWLDDDSYFTSSAWPASMDQVIAHHHPFDVAGCLAKWGPEPYLDAQYMDFALARPWWRSKRGTVQGAPDWVPFVLGGLFIARTQFLRVHDYPDRGMIKAMDDVALGELVRQVGGRMIGVGPELLHMTAIGQGERRGTNVNLADGWIRPGHTEGL